VISQPEYYATGYILPDPVHSGGDFSNRRILTDLPLGYDQVSDFLTRQLFISIGSVVSFGHFPAHVRRYANIASARIW
jgi:hypothetical protein